MAQSNNIKTQEAITIENYQCKNHKYINVSINTSSSKI